MNFVTEETVWVLAQKWNTDYMQSFVPPGIQEAKTPWAASNKCCLAILLLFLFWKNASQKKH